MHPLADAGRVIAGRYALEAPIGRGAMGVVWRARDQLLDRDVAIKEVQIADTLTEEEQATAFQRTLREAKTAARLNHPAVVTVYDVAEDGGRPWIVMRLVHAPSLDRVLADFGPLSPRRAAEMGRHLLSALSVAHAAGVMHRDVKPSNVLLRRDGRAVLTDFGIATFQGDPRLTHIGMVMGSPGFTAPERIRGEDASPASDLWSLGATIYAAVEGNGPFGNRGGAITTMSAIINEEAPEAPTAGALGPVIAALLRREPADRPDASAAARMINDMLPQLSDWAPEAATDNEATTVVPMPPGSALTPTADNEATTVLPMPPDRALTAAVPYETTIVPRSSRIAPPEVGLRSSFRYVHEPLSADEDALPSLGNETISAELQSRLLHSRGGAFLISGFRGVGKSTMVLRVLDKIAAAAPPDIMLPVWLSVARSTTTERLLFAIVRRVFEALADSAVLERLSPETRHALLIAYMRTSLSFKETQSEARERSAGLDVGVGKAAPIADLALPKLSMSAKRSQALATEAAFLAYSETDAEYDLMRIVSLVGKESLVLPSRRSGRRPLSWWPPGRPRYEKARLRLVIVLDEVDKITVENTGLDFIEELLSGIKNILTTSGAHFLIVAGPDLHDRAVRDAARGNGVYESVFGWRMYVPCLWEAPDRLIRDVIKLDTARGLTSLEPLEPFVRYLRFKARGVPRRLLQEFNSFVSWEDNSPVLRLNPTDIERVEFYARIESIMREYFDRFGKTRLFPVPIDEDRWRLGGYYVADWVLRSDGEPFSASDLLREGDDADFDPLLRISRGGVEKLLDHLADRRILEVVREFNAGGTMFGDVGESEAKVYRLAEEIRLALFGLAVQHETERASQDISISVAEPSALLQSDIVLGDSDRAGPDHTQFGPLMRPPPIKVIGRRYELSRLLGQGGMGSVFVGRDRLTGQQVAVKMLRSSLTHDSQAMLRARREAELAKRLSHPQLVRTLDVADGPDGSPALIMELLDGPTLSLRIQEQGPMQALEVVNIAKMLAGALGYLADQGVARIDLKPSNIIMEPRRGPVIIDLGVARDLEASNLTDAHSLIGTPMYMAPELIRGNTPDPRVDIYSLGLVLYYCLVGRNPWEHLGDVDAIMMAVLYQQIDVSGLSSSEELKHVIKRATERTPGSRYQTAAEMLTALTATPESRT